MAVKATAKSVSISPKKLQRVVRMVRGKRVEEALTILRFLPTPAAEAVAKVVKSAAANAENNLMMAPDELRVISISADPGPTTKRFRAAARGRAARIKKRSSHITVVVDQEEP
jgi:large subunit ribosomal protein L22